MSFASLQAFLKSRYAFAMAVGACLACAFPNIGIAGTGWIAPGMLLLAALGLPGKEAFRVGFAGALAHYLVSLTWLLNIPYRWLGLPVAPAAGWMALSGFMAIWMAVWVWIMNGTALAFASYGAARGSEAGSMHLLRSVRQSWSHGVLWPLLGAAAWVSFEMFVTRIFGGFPWNLLGASQYSLTPLIQIASVTGIYGVSFLMVWFSLALASALAALLHSPGRSSVWVFHLLPPLLTIAVLLAWGMRQISPVPEGSRQLKVALLQPSIPQTLIWNPANDDERFQALLELCRKALESKPDLVIWPEAAIPKLLRFHSATYEAVTSLAREHKVWMIVGADDAEPRRDTPDPDDADYFNSSFLITPEGELAARYKKRSLVIFGEYIPLVKWVPVLSWFTPIESGFTAGDQAVPFILDDLGVETSVLICYEDVFPQVGRSAVRRSTDFLVNITNNGWFGEGAAQWQHGISGVFRAVENRRPLIRCTNSGLTCWVDEFGRLREVFRDAKGSIYGPGIMRFEIALRPPGQAAPLTFFTRYGDVFGWACVALTVWPAFSAARHYRKDKRKLPDEGLTPESEAKV